jgi:TM2 domain-containing membrane protein YozV
MSFIILYCVILSCYKLGKKYVPKIHQFIQFLMRLPHKSPWLTVSVAIACFFVIHEEEFQFSKILTPIFFAQREVELVPSELMQHFRPHSEDKYVFELLKQLMGFALVM